MYDTPIKTKSNKNTHNIHTQLITHSVLAKKKKKKARANENKNKINKKEFFKLITPFF
jgi:hypothetical protein